ncbi:hypothetical protein AB0O04_37515, partial [Streptomyces althioticus]
IARHPRTEYIAQLVGLNLYLVEQPTGFASDPQIDAIATLLATLPPEAQDEVLRRVRGNTPAPAPAPQETDDTRSRHRRAG